MDEIWKPIASTNGNYEISNVGNVRSTNRTIKSKKGFKTYKGKILRKGRHSAGYFVVNIRENDRIKQKYVHRLVAEAFIGPANSLFINHKDCNKTNNIVANLEYVTHAGNLLHAFKSGIKVGKTKLNALQRKEIKALRKQGFLLHEIAALYNMSESGISEVVRGTTWAWE